MSSAVSHHASTFVPGDIRFVDAADICAHVAHAESRGLLAVELTPPGPAARGQLARHLEAAIESALVNRGACPPGIGAAASLDASLSDQLYRARLLELRGFALAVCSLHGIADLRGALDPDDGAVLRFFVNATREAPIQLVFARENESIGIYGPPEPLSDLISEHAAGAGRRDTVPVVAPETAASAAAMELSDPPPAVIETDGALAFVEPPEAAALDALPSAEDHEPTAPLKRTWSVAPAADLQTAESALEHARRESEASAEPAREHAEHAEPADHTPLPIGDLADALLRSLSEQEPAPAAQHATEDASPAPAVREPSTDGPVLEPRAERPNLRVPPLFPNADKEWRGWLADLQAARGPRPLSVIERMFVTSYIPLRYAVTNGLGDEDAQRALETWSTSFANSYREAFEALRVRGKRPTMVVDVPELALRIARLHGARQVVLVLVDALRFDLGLLVEQRVRALVGQQAALTERLLLWSALPSTTETQLELIGRGPEALREPMGEPSLEVTLARGRAAATLRRVKTGHRELLKLDLVQARLSEPGPAERERLDRVADETANVLAEHLIRQPARTLVVAFGDHGFLLDRLDGGTRAARSGGSTPEEVFVPAFAWLVGGVH